MARSGVAKNLVSSRAMRRSIGGSGSSRFDDECGMSLPSRSLEVVAATLAFASSFRTPDMAVGLACACPLIQATKTSSLSSGIRFTALRASHQYDTGRDATEAGSPLPSAKADVGIDFKQRCSCLYSS